MMSSQFSGFIPVVKRNKIMGTVGKEIEKIRLRVIKQRDQEILSAKNNGNKEEKGKLNKGEHLNRFKGNEFNK